MTKKIFIKVMWMDGDDPFIFHVNGPATISVLQEIEADIKENGLGCMHKGDGNYELEADYFEGQYGEYGRCELAPGWELSLIDFVPLPDLLSEG